MFSPQYTTQYIISLSMGSKRKGAKKFQKQTLFPRPEASQRKSFLLGLEYVIIGFIYIYRGYIGDNGK